MMLLNKYIQKNLQIKIFLRARNKSDKNTLPAYRYPDYKNYL
jgi:hypothetical protein